MVRVNFMILVVVLLIIGSQDVKGRRGRARGRSKSKVRNILISTISLANQIILNVILFQTQIGMPITGKYRDPESDQYYNNNDVSKILFQLWSQ